MKWKTIVNTGAEKGFIVGYNSTANTINSGTVVCWAMSGTSDGYNITVPSSTNASLVAGLAVQSIAASSKGLIQVYGVHDSAVVCRVGSASNDPLEVGDVLDIYSASSCLKYAKGGADVISSLSPMFVAAQSVASGGASSLSTTTAKVFIRCL